MGTVYLARAYGAGGFERDVALKVLLPYAAHRETLTRDLIEEAKLTVLIRHPNVVQVHDVEEDEHGVFMTMEYVEGASLFELLRRARKAGVHLPSDIGLRVLIDALAGLHAAHELEGPDGRPLGLIHRDFSPHNILIGMDGVGKLADFGIAKASIRDSHTATGEIKGKIPYLAPERINGPLIDRRSDVWAAGIVAWELLADRRPFEQAAYDAALLYRIMHEPIPRLHDTIPEIALELSDAVAGALARAPSARCPSAEAFARSLEAAAEVAPHSDVAAALRRFCGADLEARRARTAEILAVRRAASQRAPEIAAAPAPAAPPSPLRATMLPDEAVRVPGARFRTVGLLSMIAGAVAAGALFLTRPDAGGGADANAAGAAVSAPALTADTSAPSQSDAAALAAVASASVPDSDASAPAPSASTSASASAMAARPAPRSTVSSAPASRKPGAARGSAPLPLADSPYKVKP